MYIVYFYTIPSGRTNNLHVKILSQQPQHESYQYIMQRENILTKLKSINIEFLI